MRFIDNGDNITDTKTNLVWQKAGSDEKMPWKEAIKYAEVLGEGWRLPTIEELISIVEFSRFNPAINKVFECRSPYYWSSSTYVSSPDLAWGVDFYDGGVYADGKPYSNYVRCVR